MARLRKAPSMRTWRHAEATLVADYPCVEGFCDFRGGTSEFTERITGVTLSASSVGTSYWPAEVSRVKDNLLTPAYMRGWSGEDCLLISCGRWVADGGLGAYIRSAGVGDQFRVHTYFGGFGYHGGIMSQHIATKQNAVGVGPLTVGTDYICAIGKNGDLLTHFAPDYSITTADMTTLLDDATGFTDDLATTQANMAALYNTWNSDSGQNLSAILSLGHGGLGLCSSGVAGTALGATGEYYGLPHMAVRSTGPDVFELPGSFAAAGTNEQDYYGIMWCIFDDGWPGDAVIQAALADCKSMWTQGIKLPPLQFRGVG